MREVTLISLISIPFVVYSLRSLSPKRNDSNKLTNLRLRPGDPRREPHSAPGTRGRRADVPCGRPLCCRIRPQGPSIHGQRLRDPCCGRCRRGAHPPHRDLSSSKARATRGRRLINRPGRHWKGRRSAASGPFGVTARPLNGAFPKVSSARKRSRGCTANAQSLARHSRT